ncbi:MAG: hypothetical protein GEV11_17175 [Streptosporangiales bacterium]|nr:hypothetical protein [Streptosporangiales bacterium]
MVAVAGYAETQWRPREQSLTGQFITAYRDRLYLLLQVLSRFGQTWRHTNVAYIVPGFASVYRSTALRQIDVNPHGLVIEDFNMTFELHRKRLGRIGFKPGVKAYCQEPHTLGDYYRQVRRWTLGFWQTVRRHGVWPSLFWAALILLILEVVVTSIGFLAAIGLAVFLALPPLTGDAVLGWDLYAENHAALSGLITLPALAFGIFVPDYFMTCMVAAYRRRPKYLLLGMGFLALRAVDAAISLRTIPQGWTTRSTGVWRSPSRR